MKVVFLAGAEADLLDLRRYILRSFGPQTWQQTKARLRETVDTIRSFPLGGSIPDELADLGLPQYRQMISGMNRLIYEVSGDTVFIHIVCDTRRDMRTLLGRRLLRAE